METSPNEQNKQTNKQTNKNKQTNSIIGLDKVERYKTKANISLASVLNCHG